MKGYDRFYYCIQHLQAYPEVQIYQLSFEEMPMPLQYVRFRVTFSRPSLIWIVIGAETIYYQVTQKLISTIP